eukprot:TRINITY_DN8616_c0_g1_i1.p1 TRINITY_DN8616_c0_g1~~TRINITY_DN8616_c0_g1_i1.p1  ORF type:complete len:277 (-),score=61.32 TRINITY_DN8616_c0_g1_i1:8-838(-)
MISSSSSTLIQRNEKEDPEVVLGDLEYCWKSLKHSQLPPKKHDLDVKPTYVRFYGARGLEDDGKQIVLGEEGDSERPETSIVIQQDPLQERGYRLWKAAHYFIRFLQAPKYVSVDMFVGKRVIEIGAGTGLAGLGVACLGANVILTDLPSVLKILEINVEANRNRVEDRCVVSPLVWGEDCSSLGPPFDFVIASDVLYTQESHKPLLKTLCALSDQNTTVIMAYERRRKINDKFFKLVRKFFEFKVISAKELVEGSEDEVTIYIMKKLPVIEKPKT